MIRYRLLKHVPAPAPRGQVAALETATLVAFVRNIVWNWIAERGKGTHSISFRAPLACEFHLVHIDADLLQSEETN